MRKLNRFFLLTLFTFCLFAARPSGAQEENLLQNPGFEGEFFAWNGIGELQVAHGWTPWYLEDPNHDPIWARPEWKRAQKVFFPARVLSGDSSQQWFTFYKSHFGGMYQQVTGVVPGQTYRFSIWVQAWSSLEDQPHISNSPANPHFKIGIDPTGAAHAGWSNAPSTVVWSGDASMSNIIDKWGLLTIDVTAQNDVITVYMHSNPDFGNKHNDIYIDHAGLILVSDTPPTAVPATAIPTVTTDGEATPIVTQAATAVPNQPPTNTPVRVLTRRPTEAATATQAATATEAPTETSVATAMPVATVTPAATATTEPTTASAVATNTPVPAIISAAPATTESAISLEGNSENKEVNDDSSNGSSTSTESADTADEISNGASPAPTARLGPGLLIVSIGMLVAMLGLYLRQKSS